MRKWLNVKNEKKKVKIETQRCGQVSSRWVNVEGLGLSRTKRERKPFWCVCLEFLINDQVLASPRVAFKFFRTIFIRHSTETQPSCCSPSMFPRRENSGGAGGDPGGVAAAGEKDTWTLIHIRGSKQIALWNICTGIRAYSCNIHKCASAMHAKRTFDVFWTHCYAKLCALSDHEKCSFRPEARW